MIMKIVFIIVSSQRDGASVGRFNSTSRGRFIMIPAHSVSQAVVLRTLGNRLRYLRKVRQLRQLDVEDLGLSYKYYQRLEAGQVNPTLLTLHRLAVAFEVSIRDLLAPGPDQDALGS
jgi:DNA-binding XRE family transcriptional regulator